MPKYNININFLYLHRWTVHSVFRWTCLRRRRSRSPARSRPWWWSSTLRRTTTTSTAASRRGSSPEWVPATWSASSAGDGAEMGANIMAVDVEALVVEHSRMNLWELGSNHLPMRPYNLYSLSHMTLRHSQLKNWNRNFRKYDWASTD